MGAEASTEGDTGFAVISKHPARGIPWVARSRLIAKWRKRKQSTQLFAVARHVERADGLYATVQGGDRWTQTEDFKRWPLDPPISDNGFNEARLLGEKLRSAVQETGAAIPVVICSPYLRCVQTAVEICHVLGPEARMLVDRELGEVFGPAIMGHQQPFCPVRSIEDTNAYCASRGVKCHSKLIGKWPAWPEDLKSARHRYANRFLTYLQRGSVTRRNFILVTHADCVGAALSMMPSQMDHAVQSVDYGGTFVARRLRRDAAPEVGNAFPKGRRNSLPRNFASILPADQNEDLKSCNSEELNCITEWEETQSDSPFTAPKMDSWVPQGGRSGIDHGSDTAARMDDVPLVELPEASDGWQVHTQHIELCRKGETTASKDKTSSRFTKRVKTLAKNTSFSKERITTLLGMLSEKTLGGEEFSGKNLDRGEEDLSPQRDSRSKTTTANSFPTMVSFSTFIFGSSDVANMSDCGSLNLSPSPTFTKQELEDLMKAQPASPTSPKRHTPRRSDSFSSERDSLAKHHLSPVHLNSRMEDFAALLEERAMSSSFEKDVGSSGHRSAHPPELLLSSALRRKTKRLSWAKVPADAASDSGARLTYSSDGSRRESTASWTSGDHSDDSKQFGHSPKTVQPFFFPDSSKSRRKTRISLRTDSSEVVFSGVDLSQGHDAAFGKPQAEPKGMPHQEVTRRLGQLKMLNGVHDLADPVRSDYTGHTSKKSNLCEHVPGPKLLQDEPKATDSVIIIDGPQRVGNERKAVPLKDLDSSMLSRRRKLAAQTGSGEAPPTTESREPSLGFGRQVSDGQVYAPTTGGFGRQISAPAGRNSEAADSVIIKNGSQTEKTRKEAGPLRLEGSLLMRRRNMKLSMQAGSTEEGSSYSSACIRDLSEA